MLAAPCLAHYRLLSPVLHPPDDPLTSQSVKNGLSAPQPTARHSAWQLLPSDPPFPLRYRIGANLPTDRALHLDVTSPR